MASRKKCINCGDIKQIRGRGLCVKCFAKHRDRYPPLRERAKKKDAAKPRSQPHTEKEKAVQFLRVKGFRLDVINKRLDGLSAKLTSKELVAVFHKQPLPGTDGKAQEGAPELDQPTEKEVAEEALAEMGEAKKTVRAWLTGQPDTLTADELVTAFYKKPPREDPEPEEEAVTPPKSEKGISLEMEEITPTMDEAAPETFPETTTPTPNISDADDPAWKPYSGTGAPSIDLDLESEPFSQISTILARQVLINLRTERDEKLYVQIEALAAQTRRTPGDWILCAIEDYLARLKAKEDGDLRPCPGSTPT